MSETGLDGFFDSVRSTGLRRDTDDKWLAGVCSGVARQLRVDPLVVRAGLIVLMTIGGVGVLAYLVAWALLPDPDGRILGQEGLRGDGGGITLLVFVGIAVVSTLAERAWVFVLVPVTMLGWWAFRSTQQGKTPEEMGAEAQQFVHRFTPGSGSPAGTTTTAEYASDQPTPPAAGPAAVPDEPPAPGVATGIPGGGAAPHGMGPGRTGAVATAPLPPRIVKDPRRRGGLLGLLLTAGLAAAAYGIALPLATSRQWGDDPQTIALAAALGAAGLALVLLGAMGRRAGFTGFLVFLLAVGAVTGGGVTDVPRGGFGDRSWSAAAQPADGFSVTAGDVHLTLAGAPDGGTVRARVGAGDVTVVVPRGTTATVVATVSAGQVQVRTGSTTRTVVDGVGNELTDPFTVGSGPTSVTVDMTLGAGKLTIVEES